MTRHQPNYYLVLGVAPTATAAEISHAYRTQLRAHHPDTRTDALGGGAESDDVLREVIAAYAVLRDPVSRTNYDRQLHVSSVPVSSRTRSSPTFRRAPIVAGPVRWHGKG